MPVLTSLFHSPTDSNPICVPKSCKRNKLEISLLPLVYSSLTSLKYSQKAMLAKKLDLAPLAELLERGHRDTGIVERIVII